MTGWANGWTESTGGSKAICETVSWTRTELRWRDDKILYWIMLWGKTESEVIVKDSRITGNKISVLVSVSLWLSPLRLGKINKWELAKGENRMKVASKEWRKSERKLQPQEETRHIMKSWINEVDVYLYHQRQDGQPSAIHPLYCCILVHANMISSPGGKVFAVFLTGWHPPCWRGLVGAQRGAQLEKV